MSGPVCTPKTAVTGFISQDLTLQCFFISDFIFSAISLLEE